MKQQVLLQELKVGRLWYKVLVFDLLRPYVCVELSEGHAGGYVGAGRCSGSRKDARRVKIRLR